MMPYFGVGKSVLAYDPFEKGSYAGMAIINDESTGRYIVARYEKILDSYELTGIKEYVYRPNVGFLVSVMFVMAVKDYLTRVGVWVSV